MPDDFSQLRGMTYSGRGITIGMTLNGDSFIGYTLTGRSPSSQARELKYDENAGLVRTALITNEDRLRRMFSIQNDADLQKLKAEIEKGNPALLAYPAIASVGRKIVASNGAQTKLLYSVAKRYPNNIVHHILKEGMGGNPQWEYDQNTQGWIDITSFEPDDPNFTPRISACIDRIDGAFHIVRKGHDGDLEDIDTFGPFSLELGKILTIATYQGGNEKPLLPFNRDILRGEVKSKHPKDIAESLYDVINHPNPNDGNKNYAVAAAVMLMKKSGVEVSRVNRWDGF